MRISNYVVWHLPIVLMAVSLAGCYELGKFEFHDSSSSQSSESDGTNTAGAGGTSTSNGGSSAGASLVVSNNGEIEPNDDRMSANPIRIPGRDSTSQRIGFAARGTVDSINDTVDTWIFTVPQAREFNLYLCGPSDELCIPDGGLGVLTVFFRLLDQDGNVLLTSQGNTDNGNQQNFALSAGVTYYASVIAGDTMGGPVEYKLIVFEAP